jgi:hypothetical protein
VDVCFACVLHEALAVYIDQNQPRKPFIVRKGRPTTLRPAHPSVQICHSDKKSSSADTSSLLH